MRITLKQIVQLLREKKQNAKGKEIAAYNNAITLIESSHLLDDEKVYMVFIQDEWNNNHYIGLYYNLKDAIPEINSFLETYNISIDTLEEYPSTFDKKVYDEKEETCLMIRGFIFTKEDLQNVK